MSDRRGEPIGSSEPAWGRRAWGVGAFSWALAAAALVEWTSQASRLGALPTSLKWQLGLGVWGTVLVAAGIFLFAVRSRPAGRVLEALGRGIESLVRMRVVSLGLAALALVLFPIAVYGLGSLFLEGLFPRLLLFWVATLSASVLLAAWLPRSTWDQRVLGVAVGYGLLVRLLAYVPEVTSYPFSLGWSEASRYYYASLFHAGSIYGAPFGPSELHPTRYLLQSIPFLIPGSPLWLHRLWQVSLWWILPVAVGALIARRHRLGGAWLGVVVAGWVVSYLFQGPMQYHLLVMVVLVLVGVRRDRPLRSTAFILLASVWAGISRLNWFPIPAILGSCLWVLEADPAPQSWKETLRWPVVWLLLGTGVAFATQAVYVRQTGLGYDRFTSSLFSDLLVYRLLPNPTFPLGILPALVLASTPLAISLWRARGKWKGGVALPGRFLVAASLFILGAGGIVVSLKIGGGSNLHNLDGFLILLLLTGFALLLGKAERAPGGRSYTHFPPFGEMALIVAIPIVFTVSGAGEWVKRDAAAAETALRDLRQEVLTASGRGERVLFISQRHLLTFGMIPNIPLEPDFETVFLMEMAMSENRPYLDRLAEMLRDRTFDLIVVDGLGTSLQGRERGFGEENDAWVAHVSTPILENYVVKTCFEGVATCLYIPAMESGGG